MGMEREGRGSLDGNTEREQMAGKQAAMRSNRQP